MPETITVSFKDEDLELPHCKAIECLALVPGMVLTQNQVWGLVHAMERDESPEVQAARTMLLEIGEPLPDRASGPLLRYT